MIQIKMYNLRAWAKERAHKRRYEAVWLTDPSTYSIVWMPWWIKSSPISFSSCPPAGDGGCWTTRPAPSASPFSVVAWPLTNCKREKM